MLISIGSKSFALNVAERKRTHYPVDYAKNKKLKASFIVEELNVSDDEPTTSPRQTSVNKDDVSKLPVTATRLNLLIKKFIKLVDFNYLK